MSLRAASVGAGAMGSADDASEGAAKGDDLAALLAEGWALDADRVHLPEHRVKDILDAAGVATPRRVVVTNGGRREAASSARGLASPLVLKAFGPGIVHKSDLGAVHVGLAAGQIETAVDEMARHLRAEGVTPAGYLIEEQAPQGIELLVGAVRRAGVGVLAVVGLGGTLTELVDDVSMGLGPLSEEAAWAMLNGFRASAVLDGARGAAAVDKTQLVKLLLAVAGAGGIAETLGPHLVEFECNPVRVRSDAVIALDARLVLTRRGRAGADGAAGAATDFRPLLRPRSVGIAGASTSGKASFGNRALAAYQEMGWGEGLVALHPTAPTVAGVPGYASAAAVPGGLDYLQIALPAATCAQVLRDGAGHVRFAHVISGGFGEAGPDGATLEAELLATARAAGIRVLGPNCLGMFSPIGRHSFLLDAPKQVGPVSVISQSGGLSGDIVKAGDARGIHFAHVIAIGNSADVNAGELVNALVDDESTEIIGLYLEGMQGGEQLVAGLRRAAGRKPVVALVGGLSRQGAQAASSHTGSLAGERRIWDAISAATGAAVVTTLEDFLGALAFVQRYQRSPAGGDRRVLVIGVGGGASVLAADACDRAGLEVARLGDDLQSQLRAMGFGVGTSVANPLEITIGPLAPADACHQALGPVLAREPFSDLLWHVNVQSYYSYGGEGIGRLFETIELFGEDCWPETRVSVILRNLECAPPADVAAICRRCIDGRRPFFRSFDEACLGIAAGKRFASFAAKVRP